MRGPGGRAQRRWATLSVASKARARRAGYTVALVVNAILTVLIHGLPPGRCPHVTARFIDVRGAPALSLGATIIASALSFAYAVAWLRDLIQIARGVLALLVTVVFYRGFPFDFGDTAMNELGHLILGLLHFLLVVAIPAQTIAWIDSVARRALPADRADAETSSGPQRSTD